jgi:hypothetical protein
MRDVELRKAALMFLHFSLAEISLAPYASWDQNGTTAFGWQNGTSGPSLSQLDGPFGISITSNDVMYISDTNNHRIVVGQLGVISNVSVIGSGPGSGPNQFNMPYDLFITDTSLYVIDSSNHRVQNLTLDGSISVTVPGLSALQWPYYLYVDNDDNIYLSDTLNNRVLLFYSSSTNFTTVAGTGVVGATDSQLNTPYGVFVNYAGTIYIADYSNHRIMMWFAGASSGTRVAGDTTAGFSSTQVYFPTQVIVDTNEYLYISEAGSSRITRWVPGSTFGECIAACTGTAGIGPTQLNTPHSLAFDSDGSLYVSDRANSRVQKFGIIPLRSKYLPDEQSSSQIFRSLYRVPMFIYLMFGRMTFLYNI